MLNWNLEKKSLPLKFLWKISRGSLETKETYFVRCSGGALETLGEVSPNTRYGNTPSVIEADFSKFATMAARRPELDQMSMEEFGRWLDELSLCKTLRFGVESAWLSRQSRLTRKPVSILLGLSEVQRVETSFSVPIMDSEKLEEFIAPLSRFRSLKIKVDAKSGTETIRRVSEITKQALRIDGNEDWTDPTELMKFVESLRGKNIEFLEQPMPAAMKDAYREVLPKMPFPLIADESIENTADFEDLKTQFSGINVKLMKTGSLVVAAELLKGARRHGMKTMVGCMVETSMGISAAMHLCSLVDYPDLDGHLLLKEDPFNLIDENGGILTFRK